MRSCKWILAAVLAATPLLAEEPISDNSFFIEEAYNQDPGVVQHIGTFERMRDGDWESAFTQEWPLFSQQHQLSYSVPFGESGLGDVALTYRYQMLGVEGGRWRSRRTSPWSCRRATTARPHGSSSCR
jgi:hypothetical protein